MTHGQKTLEFVKKRQKKQPEPSLWERNLQALDDFAAIILGINRKSRPDWRIPIIKVRSPLLERWTRNLRNGYNVACRLVLVTSVCIFYGLGLAETEVQNTVNLERQQAHAAHLVKEKNCARWVAYYEARNQSLEGMVAVISTLMNRADAWNTGSICKEAARKHLGSARKIFPDFSGLIFAMNTRSALVAELPQNKLDREAAQRASDAADLAFNEDHADPTNGSLYFISNPGKSVTAFEAFKTNFLEGNWLTGSRVTKVGDHWFFARVEKRVPVPLERPAKLRSLRVAQQ